MTVCVERETDFPLPEEYEKIIRSIISAAMDYTGCPYEARVEVTIVDDGRIRELNREFRQVDSATDVLSFPMVDYEAAGDYTLCEQHPERYFDAESGELLLGDIVISAEKLAEQAEAYGHSPKRELAFLTAHSMLHLFGYDHMEDEQRKQMEQMQEEILAGQGYTRDME